MLITINKLCQHLRQRVYEVYDVFKNFFGNDFVDLQFPISDDDFKRNLCKYLIENNIQADINNPDRKFFLSGAVMYNIKEHFDSSIAVIYVWWPKVTVTNENGKSTGIQDLYAKVEVSFNGLIPIEYNGFLLNRATYTKSQFLSNYLHSHVRSIPKTCFREFQAPCLGSGPIADTILTLKSEYDEAAWMLFCQELSLYVTVESIAGGPWRRLEGIGMNGEVLPHTGYRFYIGSSNFFINLFSKDVLKSFIIYYLEHGHLSLSYKEGAFVCLMPYHEFIIDISNSFINYYNEHLATTSVQMPRCFDMGLLCKAVFSNNTFYNYVEDSSSAPSNLNDYNDEFVLHFKEKDIFTKIIDEGNSVSSSTVVLLSNSVAMFILDNILRIINFRYENEYNNSHSTVQTPSSTPQRVIYI